MDKKYVTIIDNTGRNILGTVANETPTEIDILNPVMISVTPQNGQFQVQLIPLFLGEFISPTNNERNFVYTYSKSNIAVGKNFTIDNTPNFAYSSASKWFTMSGEGGITYASTLTSASDTTCVFIMKTTDGQSLFWQGDPGSSGSYYLGAYSPSNAYYNGNVSVNSIAMNTTSIPNLYNYITTGNMMMLEFKGCNFATNPWPQFKFNKYSSFTFENGAIAAILIYNKTLSASESTQNYTYFGGRYGF